MNITRKNKLEENKQTNIMLSVCGSTKARGNEEFEELGEGHGRAYKLYAHSLNNHDRCY